MLKIANNTEIFDATLEMVDERIIDVEIDRAVEQLWNEFDYDCDKLLDFDESCDLFIALLNETVVQSDLREIF